MKRTIAIAALLAATSTVALAQQGGFSGPSDMSTATTSSVQGGFSGPSDALMTVEQAKTMRDDAKVILRGKIERQIRGDHYLFRDQSGTIEIEIDHDEWHGVSITPQDVVEIAGEIDKDFRSIKVDVDYLKKIN